MPSMKIIYEGRYVASYGAPGGKPLLVVEYRDGSKPGVSVTGEQATEWADAIADETNVGERSTAAELCRCLLNQTPVIYRSGVEA